MSLASGFGQLQAIIAYRKKLESIWQAKNETILQKTDVNFPDIHGKTLLEYAIELEEITLVRQLLLDGAYSRQALSLAKKTQNEEIIRLIINATSSYEFNDDPIQAFEEVYQDYLAFKTDETKKHFLLVGAKVPFELLLEKIQSEPMHDIDWLPYLDSYDAKGETPLLIAIHENNYPFFYYLIEKGCNIESAFLGTTTFTPMAYAVGLGRIEMAKLLIEKGANLSLVDHEGKSLLNVAVAKGYAEIAKLLLLQPLSFVNSDYYGRTVLHAAAEMNNSEIAKLIIHAPDFYAFITTLDYMGRSPVQIANGCQNEAFLSELGVNANVSGNKQTKISQFHIIKQLRYYLKLTNQDPNTLHEEGQCNGLVFLFLLLQEKGKGKDFFLMLNAISTWSGCYEELHNKDNITQLADDYPSLGAMFRYFVDHIILMQTTGLDSSVRRLCPWQDSRKRQYALIGQAPISFSEHFYARTRMFTREQLREYIEIIARLPEAKIELGGGKHATAFYLKAKEMTYYDPNMLYEISSTDSIERVVDLIQNCKYISLFINANQMEMNIRVFGARQHNFNTYTFFDESEFPQSLEEAAAYQSSSPNKLTQCHIALMVDSVQDFRKLITNGYVDLNACDVNGDTVLDMARKYHKTHFIDIIFSTPGVSIDLLQIYGKAHSPYMNKTVLEACNNHLDSWAVDVNQLIIKVCETMLPSEEQIALLLVLIAHSPNINESVNDIPLIGYMMCHAHLMNEPMIHNMLMIKNMNINTKILGETLFHWALKNQVLVPTESVLQWIEWGADIHTPSELDKATSLEYAIFWQKDIRIIQRLLEKGANPNRILAPGTTVLHYAVEMDNVLLVKTLLKYGASLNLKNVHDKTPIDLAEYNPEIMKLFTRKCEQEAQSLRLNQQRNENEMPSFALDEIELKRRRRSI
ncbi:ankyrin repeat domain-containing protein [Candidatus Berkiella aquae]|uniref:Ankyrin repeat domain-containing protein n=1 Tax=Candidatus Berkiella aquae TaxID=295108 RepID=A0A0Q9YYL7_9GAMM|nr:ankyrin repeat domain-containing protein [Candidatus Berkiella aquae]MCS5710515.1 ankyrin repeat domain-containing protein [Candidatus Berkiella aquae]